jgi:hypothetical protein
VIAALFVQKNGCYFGLEGVDPWDEARDARKYAGPWPVVAHPPCSLWCGYAALNYSRYGGEHNRPGNDGGLFASALASVRELGGVLEHPAYTRAWPAYGLLRPSARGGWERGSMRFAGGHFGWTCHVEQCHYGHRARKATWLYYVGPKPPELRWGRGVATAWCSPGASAKVARGKAVVTMSKRERQATPPAFRDLLLALARKATV